MAKNKLPKEAIAQEAWISFTPSISNVTIGNGTLVAKYMQVGKTVHFYVKFTLGSTSAITGRPAFALPINAANDFMITGWINDNGTAGLPIQPYCISNYVYLDAVRADSIYPYYVNVSSTIPMTWTTGDYFQIQGTYEAA